ncbi:BQ5605_C044g12156 [Microbotryum silenes-dioicae]|uniref:BQ5605_C044g12156 protein n=1 Tax=Microbotryum silenes-dioicae TaxID=796604 RepID=A0A2X0NBL7_9BASI|nr:BQ5605_C044g12156 [Microbotryum silenes-dioicae]
MNRKRVALHDIASTAALCLTREARAGVCHVMRCAGGGGPSQPRQVLGARVAPYHGLPWACSSARCWAPRGSTLLFASAPGSNRAQIPQAHVSIRDDLGPQTAVCTHCKARHWECERSKSTRHFGACCSQGKVRLPPPPQPNLEYRQLLQGSDSEAVAFRENARSYNNALSFTSLAALWDQTQVGTLGPPVFRVFGRLYHRLGALIPAVNQCTAFAQTWLINPAEATDTRLEPDGADSHMQRSTLTKLESMLRTKNHFVREFASAKPRAGWDTAKEWILRLCLPPGRDRLLDPLLTPTHPQPSYIEHGNGDAYLRFRHQHGGSWTSRPYSPVVSSLHPSAMPLRYPLLFPAGEDGFHPNIPLCGFHQARPPIARN